ncbi:class I SAM-dependent RNA methyltransferase [Williamsia phyllosphaerae]|uniref:RNA methyltransferase Cgl1903/cg2084 n=1 Tax=Williamsia phyllosphaerae TaxID=885042 RepID=A0ABQ1V7R6_9NOCA|nr:class I SAM-dependent RNA methyltransferase [Williamsia phyllosphaerae]GGF41042.1 putative RNA methyltransferase Cgl1903/cg2084 [Williamsia phyllosphaerae]
MSEQRPQATVTAGDRFEIDGLRAAHGGVVVGRHDGRAVFVRNALPDERVLVEVTDARKPSFCHARVIEILDPSPHRIDPLCPAAAAGAGCCDLSFVDDTHARSMKSLVVGDLLERVGGFETGQFEVPVRSLGAPSGWRTRVRMGVDATGTPGTHVHASDAIVVGVDCAQPVDGLLADLTAHRYRPGSELVVVLDADGARHLTEITASGPPEPTDRRSRDRQGRRRSNRSYSGDRGRAQRSRAVRPRSVETVIAGDAMAVHRVGDRRWDLPVTAFWQAHREAPTRYGATVVSMAQAYAPSARVAWDLYGGVGVFAGQLVDELDGLDRVLVVEADTAAVTAAEATFAGDDRVRIVRAPVADALDTLDAPDIVVVDPPRSGAGRGVVGTICAAEPELVVHIGCDAATFARDLGTYRELGYRPVEIEGFDAFPMTHHVEAIAALVPVR